MVNLVKIGNKFINADCISYIDIEEMTIYLNSSDGLTSGILCSAIAIAIEIPCAGSSYAVKNVAKPSGKLCIAITSAENNPIF